MSNTGKLAVACSTAKCITKASKYSGYSLFELLIAITLNVIILMALISIFSTHINHYTKSTYSDTLYQQLELAIETMANDIRRAGYWGNTISNLGTAANNNPYQATGMDITVTGGNCILFTYDYNSNGSIPALSTTSDDERYGYRLSGTTLQIRPPGAAFACNAATSAWENITDSSKINITNLSFTLNSTTVPVGATSNRIQIRSVAISITGQLVIDPTVTKTLTQHVKIMNDKYVP